MLSLFYSNEIYLVSFTVPPAYYAHLVAFRARYYMEGESFDTDSGPSQTRDAPVPVQFLPQLKDQVKEVMFYC